MLIPSNSSNPDSIKVLIVDDSAVMRRLIRNALLQHKDIEVIGTANDGVAAIEFIKKTRPDIVTLDIEMPIMDGLEALREIRKFDWTLPIIMFSSLTQRGAESTIVALTNGASDYVGKPGNISDPSEATKVLEQTLIPKIRALCSSGLGKNAPLAGRTSNPALGVSFRTIPVPALPLAARPVTGPISALDSIANLFPQRIDAVCIGVSTGGPAALVQIFQEWRKPLLVPVFIVQHMPPQFTELLANKLNSISGMPVKEATHGEYAQAGQAYIAPGGYHMVIKDVAGRVVMHLNQDPPENFCRPAVDVLFRSAAQVYASRLLGVVLTGMGSDGLKGAADILKGNGRMMVQDEATSLIWGMPGAVVRAGLAQMVLPLGEIQTEISRLTISGKL